MKGKTKYISPKDFEAMSFLYGLYRDNIEAGAWPVDDEALSEEERSIHENIRSMMIKFQNKFNV